MTHYANEYYNLDADHANPNRTRWVSGSGVLPAELLPAWIALVAAGVLAMIALSAALVLALVLQSGQLIPPLISLSLLLAWS